MNGPPPDAAREPIEAMLLADAIHGRIRRLDVVVPLQVPDDANGAHMVRPAKVENLLDHLVGRLVRVTKGLRSLARESGFAELAVARSPEIERRSRNAKASTGDGVVANSLRVVQDPLLTPDLPLFLGHLDPFAHSPPSS